MKNVALALDSSTHPEPAPAVRLRFLPPPPPPPTPPLPMSVRLPPLAAAAPRGFIQGLWLRLFGPPELDLRQAPGDFGVFRALYEVSSDHLPASGTWPSARGSTCDRS